MEVFGYVFYCESQANTKKAVTEDVKMQCCPIQFFLSALTFSWCSPVIK